MMSEEEITGAVLIARLEEATAVMASNREAIVELLNAMDRKIDGLEKRLQKLEDNPHPVSEYLPRWS